MDELINKYLDYIKGNKLSLNTIDAYARDIYKFKVFLEYKNEAYDSINSITIMNYIQSLVEKGKKNSSIARNIICIRNFYKYLLKYGYIEKAPIIDYDIPKYERNIPEVLSFDEVNLLLSTPDIRTEKGIRDKAMMEVMYATGIKITEMLDLYVKDINLEFEYLICKSSKGLERIIPLGKYSVEWLKKYLDIRNKFNEYDLEYLFLNSKGERMTRQGFWKIIKAYSRKAGINKTINLYTLRHSIAVHLIENGADFATIKELLGYKDISAIQIYMNVIKKGKLMEVYKNAHPRA